MTIYNLQVTINGSETNQTLSIVNSQILILGVTASGKGRLAFDIAKAVDGQILSVDSMKVYRRMDIGTGKPGPQIRRQVKYHLIDVVEPSESFSVDVFLQLLRNAVEKIEAKGKPLSIMI